MNIRRKIAHGAFWVFLEKSSQQISSFIVFTLIARFIGPQQYGFVALCSVFMSLAINIISGMVDPIIALRVRNDVQLSTLFWIVNGCGLLLTILTLIFSGVFAALMQQDELAPLLRSFSAVYLLIALGAIPSALMTARLDFRVFTMRTLVATLGGGFVGIIMAAENYGAYAIAGQQIAYYALHNVVMWWRCGWHPRWTFNLTTMKSIANLGVHQIGSSLISFCEEQIPRLLLGFFIGPAAVGILAFSQRVCSSLQDILLQPVMTIIYPAFVEVRAGGENQSDIFKRILFAFGVILFPAIVGAIITADQYVPTLFGTAWTTSAPILKIALVTTLFVSISIIFRDLLKAHQRIALYFRVQLALVLAGIALAVILAPRGLYTYMWGQSAVAFVSMMVYAAVASRETGIKIWLAFANLWGSAVATAFMGLAVFHVMHYRYIPSNNFVALSGEFVVGVATYSICLVVLQYRQLKGIVLFAFENYNRA